MSDSTDPGDREGGGAGTGKPGSADASETRAVPRIADADAESGPGTGRGDDGDGGGASPLGTDAGRDPEPIEPEAPSPENALFVLLGILGTVGLLATAIAPGVL